ncbi:pyridoxamine 5'-phosphate oxidase [Motilimonas pumila]|uniref:Pyridoxine/pyridoxamine 5'-phosphate oxidase n=1 Tax=Motilimonas pumila TaxID=2303987 RepID=A0A418YG54_9GAMM|nr:pyridoxamine 5'-phosphate oxidase [Motilimonas pumila]RJG48639.1 pyridoxamine 5'-phosphate oxidase [Motilimonas pumila]
MSLLTKLKCAFTLGQGVLIDMPELQPTDDPIEFFNGWLKVAEESGIILPESMSVASCTPEGKPSSRMVLLKEVDSRGFVFYTNYGSRKAQQLDANPHCALLFHWNILQRQVRIEGRLERVSQAESEAYFHSRGRGSQIGAWASHQSDVAQSRQELMDKVKHYEKEFAGKPIPLPEFWGGYRVIPERIEFWQGKADRLHDRFDYQKHGDGWQVVRLNP